ncbi:MAG: hypothetical protein ACOCQG_01790 [Candidatus Nanoarchaeia archaeon]
MKHLKLEEKILLGLLFISMLVFANHMVVPHFVLLGVNFLENSAALLMITLFIVIIVASKFIITKKTKNISYPLMVIYAAITINSLANIVSSYFLKEDVSGFIERVYESPEFFTGFVINQIILLLISFGIIFLLFRLKRN